MIDTIGVQYPITLLRDYLTDWGYARQPKGRGGVGRWTLEVPMANGCVITYRYYPHVIKVGPSLQVEFSLSHLVCGDNLYIILDKESAINQANQMLPIVPGIPEIDLWEGNIYRLDLPYNFQVGKLVPYYLQAVQPLEFRYRKPKPYPGQGFQWRNNQWALKIYDKERWYHDMKLPINPDSKGVLRFELTLRKNKVKELTGMKCPTLDDINIEMTLDAMERELCGLNLLGRSIGTYQTTLSVLCEKYGYYAGIYYFGLLVAKVEAPTIDTIIADTGLHPKTLDRQIQKIVAANVPPRMTKADEPLPALTIDRRLVMDELRRGVCVQKYQVIPQSSDETKQSNVTSDLEGMRSLDEVIK